MSADMTVGRSFLATRRVLRGADLEAYDRLYDGAKNWKRENIIPSDLPNERIGRIMNRLFCDAPGLFWLDRRYSIVRVADTTTVVLDFDCTKEEADRLKRIVAERLEIIGRDVLSGTDDDLGMEFAIHDHLVSTVRYEDAGRPEDHSIIGPLVHGRGVCDGISASFNLIMNSLGIDCMTVTGRSRDQAHSWNIAYIDGRPCHVDVTYDLSGSHAYLNVTDSMIGADHAWRSWVRCEAEDMEYHAVNETVFGDRRGLGRYLSKKLSPECTVEFRTDPDLGMGAVSDIVSDVMKKNRKSGDYRVVSAGLGTYIVDICKNRLPMEDPRMETGSRARISTFGTGRYSIPPGPFCRAPCTLPRIAGPTWSGTRTWSRGRSSSGSP